MNIVTADFNWISLIIVIVGGIIGLVKSTSKKKSMPMPPQEDLYEIEEVEPEEDVYNDPYFYENPVQETTVAQDVLRENTFKFFTEESFNTIKEEESKNFDTLFEKEEEENEDESFSFNLRQAVISSEILNRPQY